MSSETKKPEQVPKGKGLKIRHAKPDDPIYTRGFVIGKTGGTLRPAPLSPKEKTDDQKKR